MTEFDALLWDRDLQWPNFGSARSAATVPDAVDALANATSEAEAEAAYWRLDNVVVLQGSVYEAAIAVLDSIVRLLVAGPEVARRWCLELLLQIAAGWTEPAEAERTARDLAGEAQQTLRALVPVLLAFTSNPNRHIRELSFEIVARIAPEVAAGQLRWAAEAAHDADEQRFYRSVLEGEIGYDASS